MRWRDHWATVLALLGAAAVSATEPAYRYQAPIEVQQPGAFVQLPLPVSTYAHAVQAGLADLRIVDARGERVPFAVLPPAPQALPTLPTRELPLYALPRERAPSGDWALPVTVQVQGHEIRVQQAAAPGLRASSQPPGWLIDLGEPVASTPPRALLLAWSGPADVSAPYELQTSPDLRHWTSAESGHLMALSSSTGTLTQPKVPLPLDVPRFVRLIWRDAATAPQLTTARQVFESQTGTAQDPPSWLVFEPVAATQDDPSTHAITFDLGGPVPVTQVDLDLGPGTRVLPLQIEGRATPSQPWQPVTQGVVYRLEREGQVSRSPPLPMTTAVRYLRVRPDERAAAPTRDHLRLRVQAHLPSLVFATQGQPPFTLQAGADQAKPGALPAAAVVPALDQERPHFGHAQLGAWIEDPAVARDIASAAQRAAWRPWALWSVLLAGVVGLGMMVWRLRPAA